MFQKNVNWERSIQIESICPNLFDIVSIIIDIIDHLDVLAIHCHHQFVIIGQVNENNVKVNGDLVVGQKSGVLSGQVVVGVQIFEVELGEESGQMHISVGKLFQRSEEDLDFPRTLFRQIHKSLFEVHTNVIERVKGLGSPVTLTARTASEAEAQFAMSAFGHGLSLTLRASLVTGRTGSIGFVSKVPGTHKALVILQEHIMFTN